LKQYYEGLTLVPEPKTDREAAIWLYVDGKQLFSTKQGSYQGGDRRACASLTASLISNTFVIAVQCLFVFPGKRQVC
jgi:hypothetical protein